MLPLAVEFLLHLNLSPLDGFQASGELPAFLVEIGQLLFELLLLQVGQPTLISDERFDFVPQQPISGISVHTAFTELQLARSHCGEDFLVS